MALVKKDASKDTTPATTQTHQAFQDIEEGEYTEAEDCTRAYNPGDIAGQAEGEQVDEVEQDEQDEQSNTALTAASQAPKEIMAAAAPTNALAHAEEEGFEGLVVDWTSFPSISLKTEGHFEDIESHNYGTTFDCRLLGSKRRWVYRANPVVDNKRDVCFSYDKVYTQDGKLIADKVSEWQAAGKVVEEKEYYEAMVEMVAPETEYDGEYRILSISPTSKGRFTGHYLRARALGKGNVYNVVTRVSVGAKITKVANPFYPWTFAVVKD